jgi:hypothetical protein
MSTDDASNLIPRISEGHENNGLCEDKVKRAISRKMKIFLFGQWGEPLRVSMKFVHHTRGEEKKG